MLSDKTAEQMLSNYIIYYNFIRLHMIFNDKTPSEEAGINLNLRRNRWMGLIEQSL